MKKIILASNSFRRRELLSKLNYEFDVEIADIEEVFTYDKKPVDVIKNICYKKAEKVFLNHNDKIIIAGDTAVLCDNIILGKPERELENKYKNQDIYTLMLKNENVLNEAKKLAFNMLKKMSGKTHQVITGICIMSNKNIYLDVTVSDVLFDHLTDDEIIEYVNTGEPFGKAGGYALQENAGKFIKHISGDFFSIVGFPLNLVYNELKNIDKY